MMTSGFKTKYGLMDIPIGETKRFPGVTPEEHGRIKRSAHNYNLRTNAYFTTKFKDGVLYVTRLR